MFEKIGRYAEKLATSAGQTRRGFLGLAGKGALSLAGLVGGLLLFQDEAVAASTCTGGCRYKCPDGTFTAGSCTKLCSCEPTRRFRGMTCNFYSKTCSNILSSRSRTSSTFRKSRTSRYSRTD
jgi:hypothetical protein